MQAFDWYRRLLGADPTFYPNDVEAVWQLAEDRYVYIIGTDRAGGAVSMIWVDDPATEVAGSPRGLEPTDIEKHDRSGSTSSTTRWQRDGDRRGDLSTKARLAASIGRVSSADPLLTCPLRVAHTARMSQAPLIHSQADVVSAVTPYCGRPFVR